MMDLAKWRDKALQTHLLIPHYPLLRSLTSSSEEVSGSKLRSLVNLTFESEAMAEALVDYTLSVLESRPSPAVKLKTIKTLQLASKECSKGFRTRLRSADHVISQVATVSVAGGNPMEIEAQQRLHSMREFLFCDEVLRMDERQREDQTHKLSGMGSTQSSWRGASGFGNDTNSAGPSMSARVMGFLESSLDSSSFKGPDWTKDLLMSPASHQYEPLKLNFGLNNEMRSREVLEETVSPNTKNGLACSEGVMVRSTYAPGRAGGGWDDSSSDGEDENANEAEAEFKNEKLVVLHADHAELGDSDGEVMRNRKEVMFNFFEASDISQRDIKNFVSEHKESLDTLVRLLSQWDEESSDRIVLFTLVTLEECLRLETSSQEQSLKIRNILSELKVKLSPNKESFLLRDKVDKLENIMKILQPPGS